MRLPQRIETLFHVMFSRFSAIPAPSAGTSEVTLAQMKALVFLESAGTLAVGRLAKRLGVTTAAASELADRLVRAGCVSREHSRLDRRVVHLSLRSEGRNILAKFTKMRTEKARRILSAVGRGDARRLVAALETVNEILGKVPR